MPILNWIVLILCVQVLSASALSTNSSYAAVLSPSAVLVIRGELDGQLNPDHGSTPPRVRNSRLEELGDRSGSRHARGTYPFPFGPPVGALDWAVIKSDSPFVLCF
jgi:hypothetical protein